MPLQTHTITNNSVVQEEVDYLNFMELLERAIGKNSIYQQSNYLKILRTMLSVNVEKNKFSVFEVMRTDIAAAFSNSNDPDIQQIKNTINNQDRIKKIFDISYSTPLQKYNVQKSRLVELFENSSLSLTNSQQIIFKNLQKCLHNIHQTSFQALKNFKVQLEAFNPSPKLHPKAFKFHEKVLDVISADKHYVKNAFELALLQYRAERLKEKNQNHSNYRYHLFCIGLGFNAELKIAAVDRMLCHLRGDKRNPFTADEIYALRNSNLGKIIDKFSRLNQLPKEFIVQEKSLYKNSELQANVLLKH